MMTMPLRAKWITLASVFGLSLWNAIINVPSLTPGNAGHSNSFAHTPPVTSVKAVPVVRRRPAADDQLHIALALSGREPGIFDEFEAAMKSVLLNAPLERSLFVHIFADGSAYEELEGVLNRTQVTSWETRNQVEIHAYDVQHHIKSLEAQMLATFQPSFPDFTVSLGVGWHTIGTWLRLYAHRFIELDAEVLLYIDIDCVIMANLDGIADIIEQRPSALIHWGESMTAGFMALNIRRMNEMWTIAREAPLKEIATRFKQDLNDQLVFRAINVTHPSEVNVLPIEWDMHVTARWPPRYQPFDVKTPNVGMLHFNGGSASKNAYFKPGVNGTKTWMEKFEGTWGNARYYANIPWSWARFIAMGNRRRQSSGFHLKMVSHPSPLQKESKQEKWQRMRREQREKKRLIEQSTLTVGNVTVHILYATDYDAMSGLEASVRSILKHASERVVIHHVGTDTLDPTDFPDVEFHSLVDVHRIHNLTRFTNPHLSSHWSVSRLTSLANYVRFVMADMFPDVEKMMWIDADTIIRCDIVPFFRSALSTNDHTISARVMSGNSLSLSHMGEGETFNAGVMVVDLERWRARNATAKVEEWVSLNAKKKIYSYGSQPPLQLAIGDDFERMDRNWNVGGFGGHENVTFPRCACLLHWNGARKYWLDDGFNKDLVDSVYSPCKSSLEKRREKNRMVHDQRKMNESNVVAPA